MNAPRCTRCSDPFEPRRAGDRRCFRCELEVLALIASDERRRSVVRFDRVREMTGTAA